MDAWFDVAINLVAAFIGFLVGLAWQAAARRYRFRGPRRFWQPFSGDRCSFAVGRLQADVLLDAEAVDELFRDVLSPDDRRKLGERLTNHLDAQENSGLIGLGDLQALMYINRRLDEAGMPHVLSVIDAGSGAAEGRNLVLIGGDDVNPRTRALTERLGCSYRHVTRGGRNTVWDSRLDEYHGIRDLRPEVPSGSTTVEHGIVVRADRRQPTGQLISFLVFAGAHGLGTLATARAAFDNLEEMAAYHRRFPSGFECVVRYVRDLNTRGELVRERIETFGARGLAEV
ncbi:hypothetical protein O7635_32125 [Asanoa sp. WMMD1127]|uniref:hypothetical protein n=1 Tax=Asanoa sp. WMMD1127 TaxID=3016107 RepID=UPI00241674A0|nr:hypothetical protein [Asanoa sp. WMMD1127]MDG4826522.1 hypothetical protein [Asanoa sp. WMMD1127]